MSWTLSASGHAATPEAEAALVASLREALGEPTAGATLAVFSGAGGQANLLEELPLEDDDPVEAPSPDAFPGDERYVEPPAEDA